MKFLYALFASAVLSACSSNNNAQTTTAGEMTIGEASNLIAEQRDMDTIPKTVWKQLLDEEEYHVLWQKGTERAFSGDLLKNPQTGTYVTAGCRIPVFHSKHKFESGTGWPSFWEALDKDNIILKTDRSWGMQRTEVLSACGEHLGHVFQDGPEPTGLRYCINSAALDFVPDASAEQLMSRDDLP